MLHAVGVVAIGALCALQPDRDVILAGIAAIGTLIGAPKWSAGGDSPDE